MLSQKSASENKTHKLLKEIQMDDWFSSRQPDLLIVNNNNNNNNKRTYWIMDFALSADPWEKIKESEKRYKFLCLSRELKKIWHMKVTAIPIFVGQEDLEIRGNAETI